MLKRTLTALAVVGMAATPATADLLVPDQVFDVHHVPGSGTIGVFGASVNGNPVTSPGFLGGGGGGVASQVSIPANVSDTIVVTFAFHWPFSTYYPVPYLGVQWQNRLNYDNSEVQVLGATGAGGFSAVNFGLGPNNSKMVANGPSTTTTISGATNMIPGTSTMIGVSGTPLKGFPNPSSGQISTAPGFGRFAINPPTTATFPVTFNSTTTTTGGVIGGLLLPFSSTFPIMKVTLHVKTVVQDGLVDLWMPPSSAFMLWRLLTTTTSMVVNPFNMTTQTFTNTHALQGLYFSGAQVGIIGGDHGVSVVPEPVSAALMGVGLLSLVGGFWRRRRRIGEAEPSS